MIRATFLLLAATILVGCETLPPDASRAPVKATPDVESVKFPARGQKRGVTRSNVTLAEDFIDLTFALESGQKLPGLLRYEGPVRVRLSSPSLYPYRRDLENLLARLRNEAGVNIRSTNDPSAAHIQIESVPTEEFQRAYPGAACFIVPGETNWKSYRSRSARRRARWSDQTTLGITGIFLPASSSPQDVRDCLHEEIGQALGPANDVYRLPDTVFNDDNFHSILTSFDMLMLRVLYSPEMHSGMPAAAASRRARLVLDRINPQGRGTGRQARSRESGEWKRQIETAMTRKNSPGRRLRAVNTAVQIASNMVPNDHRLAVALMTRGRLMSRNKPLAAAADFNTSYNMLRRQLGENNIRTAQAVLHLAIFSLKSENYDQAIKLTTQAIPVAKKGENAVLLSGLYAVQSEALLQTGNATRAQGSRINSLKWARYAFGDIDGAIARAQAEIEGYSTAPASRSVVR